MRVYSATAPKPFAEAAIRAFPPSCRVIATEAEEQLAPFVSDSYRSPSTQVIVSGATVYIPQRIHLPELGRREWLVENAALGAQCLITRSTDGYLRQRALELILGSNETWAIPFVVLLAGEYVIEIIEVIQKALLSLDRASYVNFVLENRHLMRTLSARATSYWDCYYRNDYPKKTSYPGLVVLRCLELWATSDAA